MSEVYEISNPSDMCTIVGEKLVAAVAVLMLGEGTYGLKDANEETVMPLFILGASPDPWLREHGIDGADDLPRYIAEHEIELADALDSVLYGDRALFEEGIALIEGDEKRKLWRQKWNDARRSSMNNIAGRAEQFAKILRQRAAGGG